MLYVQIPLLCDGEIYIKKIIRMGTVHDFYVTQCYVLENDFPSYISTSVQKCLSTSVQVSYAGSCAPIGDSCYT